MLLVLATTERASKASEGSGDRRTGRQKELEPVQSPEPTKRAAASAHVGNTSLRLVRSLITWPGATPGPESIIATREPESYILFLSTTVSLAS